MIGNNHIVKKLFQLSGLVLLAGCAAKGDYPGVEYAPQMYHSVPYEQLSQVQDEEAGRWLTSLDEGPAEFYNSNPLNPSGMTMRMPVEGTVKRNANGYLPYRIPKDSFALAGRVMKNPLDSTASVISDGKALFLRYCRHCHGDTGQGDGPVGKVYKGVLAYNSAAVKDAPAGRIFHVITHGKGRMYAHGSQVSVEDRWKIVRYVQTLQRQ
ncbi:MULTISPECIES: cytochrome c [unclassified Imperialibacter]|uniref:c-type cytochrome n=1 Tax=unclassified Imperialibacter TaxID=2629706 RepID=UPI00125ABCF0|nr:MULTISPECIES: cytochrome c [unclassified Imperialibacter]CAD5257538.1 Cytochrome C [Imperialibacter sp. 89]CAD5272519.1 Cytochrome C [Imperialibacter sp. 75]VVT32205.1 Cytochrome C [Imperialibacter sp. EC-SDR9]